MAAVKTGNRLVKMIDSFFFKKPKASKEENIAFNIDIELVGWKVDFSKKSPFMGCSFENIARLYFQYKPNAGSFIVDKKGALRKGFKDGYHKYEATLDLQEVQIGNPHLHLKKNGSIVDLDPFFSKSWPRLKHGRYSSIRTLQGLYDSLPNAKINTKAEAIRNEIFARNFYKNPLINYNNSIATRKMTKLKLLENVYKRHISDQ